MPIEVILPKFGFTLETADIVQWLVAVGDKVRAGDPICEVTTDKVNMEVEAPEDGTIHALLYEAGATVPVTQVICIMLRPGEAPPAEVGGAPAGELVPAGAHELSATPVARRVAEASSVDLTQVQGTGPNGKIMRRDVESALTRLPVGAARSSAPSGKVRATPAARRLAEESGIDLATVRGSGPRGRVQGVDVQMAAQAALVAATQAAEAVGAAAAPVRVPAAKPPAAQGAAPAVPTEDAPKIVKLEGMRRTIATRLQKSFQTAPHIFFDAAIDMTRIEALRSTLKARDEKLSVTAVLVKACTWALKRNPYLNATLEGDDISLWPTMNIGVAVALEEGLIVPVIHHAERLSLQAIQKQVDDLAARARANLLHLNDVMDGTFTISNLGMFGVDRFTAIINPPQVAILAVGRTLRQFVPDDEGKPLLKTMMQVTLSADHRVVDGANAARFMTDLRTVLEDPALLAW